MREPSVECLENSAEKGEKRCAPAFLAAVIALGELGLIFHGFPRRSRFRENRATMEASNGNKTVTMRA